MGRPLFVLNEARNKTVLSVFRNVNPNCLLTIKVKRKIINWSLYSKNAFMISNEEKRDILAFMKVKVRNECPRTNTSEPNSCLQN